MRLVDFVFVLIVLSFAAWRVFVPGLGSGRLAAMAGLAAAAAGMQWLVAGFTWQAVPGWLLIGVAALEGLGRRGPSWWRRVGFAILGGAALAPWALLPEPVLPAPDGQFAVASEVMRWTDPARPEPATPDPRDCRSVIVQAWFPAPGGPSPPYLDGLGRLPPTVMGIPRFILHRWDRVRTGTGLTGDSPPDRWPVILFSPGFGAPRAVYSGLARQLVSRGYVVVAVDHPYEAALTQLPDGRLVEGRPLPGRTEAGMIAAMDRQAQVRADDLRFVINQLTRPGALPTRLAKRLDLSRLAAGGHSFGGASAVLAAQQDPRIGAAFNLDGTLYAGAGGAVAVPVLVIESGPETPHGDRYRAGVARLLAHGARLMVLRGANHYSFTDVDFALAPPARWAEHLAMGGSRGAAATQSDTAAAIDGFLRVSAPSVTRGPAQTSTVNDRASSLDRRP